MDETVAHLVHTEGGFLNPRKLSTPSHGLASPKPSRAGSSGPSTRYKRHLARQTRDAEPVAATVPARPLLVQFVAYRGGVAVERKAGNGRVVRDLVPFKADEMGRLNSEATKATSGAVHASRATREVRKVLASRLAFAKSRAASRGRSFTLTLDGLCDLYNGQRGLCAVSGLLLDTGPDASGDDRWRKPFRVSIDRIDSTKGYEPENARLVCAAVNYAMGAWGDGVFAIIAAAFLARKRDDAAV